MDKDIEELKKRIMDKIKFLNKNLMSECYVCSARTNNWVVLIPENFDDDIGFGKADGTKTRIVFVSVCKEHNLDDKSIIRKIKNIIQIKSMALKN